LPRLSRGAPGTTPRMTNTERTHGEPFIVRNPPHTFEVVRPATSPKTDGSHDAGARPSILHDLRARRLARLPLYWRSAASGGLHAARSLDEFLTKNRFPTRRSPCAGVHRHARGGHLPRPWPSWAKTVVCHRTASGCCRRPGALHRGPGEAARARRAATLRMASEAELLALYPDCEEARCAVRRPLPAGVFVEQCFVGDPEMVFNAGTHTDCLRMHYEISRPRQAGHRPLQRAAGGELSHEGAPPRARAKLTKSASGVTSS